jgi:hypothetical protein
MSALQKIFKENSVGVVIAILLIGYGVYYYTTYLSMKGSSGSERMTANTNPAYANGNGASVQPAMPQGQNEVYSSANGIQTSMPGAPSTCNTANIQNPSELLPKDKNSQWAQLNPSGKGELANVKPTSKSVLSPRTLNYMWVLGTKVLLTLTLCVPL